MDDAAFPSVIHFYTYYYIYAPNSGTYDSNALKSSSAFKTALVEL